MTEIRNHEILNRRSSRLLIIDVQERLVAALSDSRRARLIETCEFLTKGAQLMEVPAIATEQYPSGLGPTVERLAELIADRPAKKRFSGAQSTGWPTAAEATDDRFQIVVAGMETHVCVLQTVLDLLAMGYQVYVIVDGVAARRDIDHTIALERMSNSGATLTTAEAVVFEWCESADTAQFKALSALVKSRPVS